MKDLIKLAQKVSCVISLILALFNLSNCYTQRFDIHFISNEQYEVINSVVTDDIDSYVYLYNITDFDKDLIPYFEDVTLKLITAKVGIPVTISDQDLRNILSDKIRKEIVTKIYLYKPLELNSKKLNKNILLTNSYDKPKDLLNNVKRITEPIIIGDFAVIRLIGFLESSVHILEKEKGKWLIKYTFNDWLILE